MATSKMIKFITINKTVEFEIISYLFYSFDLGLNDAHKVDGLDEGEKEHADDGKAQRDDESIDGGRLKQLYCLDNGDDFLAC